MADEPEAKSLVEGMRKAAEELEAEAVVSPWAEEMLRGLDEALTHAVLGRMVVAFSNLEHRVQEATFGLAVGRQGIPMMLRVALGELGFQRLVPVFCAAIRAADHPTMSEDDIQKLGAGLLEVSAERNRLVHSEWHFHEGEPPQIAKSGVSVKQGYRLRVRVQEAGPIRDLADRCDGLADKVTEVWVDSWPIGHHSEE